MIVLDTHMWVWWVHGDPRLTTRQTQHILDNEQTGLGVSAISCWEVAMLERHGRLTLPWPINDWMSAALCYPGIRFLHLASTISIESTRLPQPFHRDPADQIIVATARVHNVPLLTADARILGYPHVTCLT